MSVLKRIACIVIVIFALIGVAFTLVFIAMQFGLLNVRGSIMERNQFFVSAEASVPEDRSCPDAAETCAWNQTREWAAVEGGLRKDAHVIERVARETGVPARLIAAAVIPEQLRFFTSEREVFKRYFEPLKILGSLSQFSLGVSGIKQETAEAVERHARDATSPFYPGPTYAAYLAYPAGVDESAALYSRLTDPKDH
ncbi:MAG TPA: hypothetical protein VEA36_00510, partial [Candidatus Paceibacterota bacterium]|nr:hypothetical protein [Candidatus Paceibacterota bacterium]